MGSMKYLIKQLKAVSVYKGILLIIHLVREFAYYFAESTKIMILKQEDASAMGIKQNQILA